MCAALAAPQPSVSPLRCRQLSTICSPARPFLQLLSKIGVLPTLPEWPVAGKVWIETHKSFPLGKPHHCLVYRTSLQTVLPLPCALVSWFLLSIQPRAGLGLALLRQCCLPLKAARPLCPLLTSQAGLPSSLRAPLPCQLRAVHSCSLLRLHPFALTPHASCTPCTHAARCLLQCKGPSAHSH